MVSYASSYPMPTGSANWNLPYNAALAQLDIDIPALYAFINSSAATSETSLSVATGSKAFTIDQAGFTATAGATYKATSTGAPTAIMVGTVASFTGGVLTLTVTNTGGSGTHADWQITPVLASASAQAEVDVASATTTDLGAATSDNVRITGTTTITSLGTALAGVRRYVRFQGALSLTYDGTALILKGGVTRTTAANDSSLFVSLGSGNWIELLASKADGKPIVTPVQIINGYINGFTLSNDGGTPNSVLDIAAGYGADSTNAAMITGAAFTKSTAGSWSAGSAGNGMGTGLTIATSTWYHVFAIINSGAFDVYFDTSVTAANKPTNTTAFRRIGSFKTDGSAHIVPFAQDKDTFYWGTAVVDVNGVASINGATLYTLSVPTGVKVMPIVRLDANANSSTVATYLASPDEDHTTASTAFGFADVFGNAAATTHGVGSPPPRYSNTSGQIYVRSNGTTGVITLTTSGWVDDRGKA